MSRVAVVGAGPAGMAAAFRLRQAGAQVTVFEASDAVGGRTRTFVAEGCRIDAGCQLFGSVHTEVLRVLGAAGAGGLAVPTPGRDALWRKGAAHEVTYGSAASLLTSGALPFTLKLRMGAGYVPYLHRHAADLDAHALERAAAAGLDAESIAAWGRRELGRDFVDLLAAPVLAALYGTAPEETSAGLYHAVARQGMHADIQALRGGMGSFCDALAAALARAGSTVRTGSRVRALSASGDGVRLSGDGWEDAFDAAVLAVPAPVAREIGGLTPQAARWLEGVRVRPTVTLALVLERPLPVRYFALSFARGESQAVAAACVQENKVPDLVSGGRGLLVAFPLPDVGERLAGADAGTVYRTLLPDLARAFPGLESTIRQMGVFPWEHGWTVFRPGYLAHLGEFRRGGVDSGRVALAGDYLCMPNLEGAVVSGLRAAEKVGRELGVGR